MSAILDLLNMDKPHIADSIGTKKPRKIEDAISHQFAMKACYQYGMQRLVACYGEHVILQWTWK